MFTIEMKTQDAERTIQQLMDKAPFAVSRALNLAGTSVLTLMTRLISADTGIKQADLRGTTKRNRRIWVQRDATPEQPAILLFSSLERVPLMDFQARGPEPSSGKGRGVSWRGTRGGRHREPHAFIATMTSGHKGVWKRIGPGKKKSERGGWSKNLPIVELMGPSIAHVFDKFRAAALERGKEQFWKNLKSELRFAASRR